MAQRKSRREKQHGKLCNLSCLRTSAMDDLCTLASMFGQDLLEVPKSWLSEENARQLIAAFGITLSITLPLFFLEIFAGCAHLTMASV